MTNITNVLTGRSIKEWTMEPGRPLEKQKEKGKTQRKTVMTVWLLSSKNSYNSENTVRLF